HRGAVEVDDAQVSQVGDHAPRQRGTEHGAGRQAGWGLLVDPTQRDVYLLDPASRGRTRTAGLRRRAGETGHGRTSGPAALVLTARAPRGCGSGPSAGPSAGTRSGPVPEVVRWWRRRASAAGPGRRWRRSRPGRAW